MAKVFTYAGCKVNRATFSGAKGRPGAAGAGNRRPSETVASAGSFPSLTASTENGPYIFAGDPMLTLNSATREVQDFELTIQNGLVTDRFMNSLTVVNLPEGDRAVTLATACLGQRQHRPL